MKRSKIARLYQQTLSGESGEQILADLIERSGIGKIAPNNNPYDEYFLKGRRSMGLEIIKLMSLNIGTAIELEEQTHDRDNPWRLESGDTAGIQDGDNAI